jgi:hypothetical protein
MIFESEFSRNFFLNITAKYFGSENKAILKLKDIPQWVGFLKNISYEGSIFSNARTLLSNSSFYGFSNDFCKNSINDGWDVSIIDSVLYPCLRKNSLDINNYEDIKLIPSYIESIFYKDDGWEDSLRKSLSSKDMRNIKRIYKKVSNNFNFSWVKLTDLVERPIEFKNVIDTYNYNLLKYKEKNNYYSYPILDEISKSSLGEHVFIGMRYNLTGCLVQACLIFMDIHNKSIHYLVQGINHQLISTEFNLYVAAYCDVYNLMDEYSIVSLYMGRGLEKEKKSIGANFSRVIYNGCRLLNHAYENELEIIINKANGHFNI